MKVLDTPSFDDCPNALLQLCQAVQADELHFVDEYPLNERNRDTAVSATLSAAGVAVSRHVGDVIVPPHSFTTGSGGVHTVFSPYFRKWLSIAERNAESLERAPAAQTSSVASDPLPESWDGVSLQLAQADWQAGEDEAQRRLQTFVERQQNAA